MPSIETERAFGKFKIMTSVARYIFKTIKYTRQNLDKYFANQSTHKLPHKLVHKKILLESTPHRLKDFHCLWEDFFYHIKT